MPLPTPNANEEKDSFMHRCISILAHEDGGNRWPKNNQRVAVCMTQWAQKNESVEERYVESVSECSINDRINKYLCEDEGGAVTDSNIGVPDTDNAVASLYQSRKKKKKKTKFQRRSLAEYFQPIIEAAKINTEEIIVALGGETYFKKNFKTLAQAMQYVKSNVQKIISTFGLSVADVPLKAIESKLKKYFKE